METHLDAKGEIDDDETEYDHENDFDVDDADSYYSEDCDGYYDDNDDCENDSGDDKDCDNENKHSLRHMHTCPYDGCSKTASTATLLAQHMVEEHPTAPPAITTETEKETGDGCQLPKSAVCNVCDKVFRSADALRRHMNTHKSNRRIHPCLDPKCAKTFLNRSMMLTHFKVDHQGHREDCDICGRRFRHRKTLVAHKAREHAPGSGGAEGRELGSVDGGTGRFKCNECSKRYVSKSTARRHVRNLHSGRLKEHAAAVNSEREVAVGGGAIPAHVVDALITILPANEEAEKNPRGNGVLASARSLVTGYYGGAEKQTVSSERAATDVTAGKPVNDNAIPLPNSNVEIESVSSQSSCNGTSNRVARTPSPPPPSLPMGWTWEVRQFKGGQRRRLYQSPEGQRFESLSAVLRYLESNDPAAAQAVLASSTKGQPGRAGNKGWRMMTCPNCQMKFYNAMGFGGHRRACNRKQAASSAASSLHSSSSVVCKSAGDVGMLDRKLVEAKGVSQEKRSRAALNEGGQTEGSSKNTKRRRSGDSGSKAAKRSEEAIGVAANASIASTETANAIGGAKVVGPGGGWGAGGSLKLQITTMAPEMVMMKARDTKAAAIVAAANSVVMMSVPSSNAVETV